MTFWPGSIRERKSRVARELPSQGTLAVIQAGYPNNYYTTVFPLTENPTSENGVWTLGAREGLDWHNMRTTTNKAFGTQDGNQAVGVFDDSIAVLKGTWSADHRAQATVFNLVGAGADYFAEVEILMRFTIVAHSAQGYECNFGINPATGKHYTQIVKWLGARDSFFDISAGGATIAAPATGDVVSATIVGNTITNYVNGIQVLQATDSIGLSGTTPYTTGNPGMGHWLNNETGTGDPTQYGFSNYTAAAVIPLGLSEQMWESARVAMTR